MTLPFSSFCRGAGHPTHTALTVRIWCIKSIQKQSLTLASSLSMLPSMVRRKADRIALTWPSLLRLHRANNRRWCLALRS